MEQTKTQTQKAIDLFEYLEGYADVIVNCSSLLVGPHGWFNAYVKSEEFVQLSPDNRAEAVRLFLGLKDILGTISEDTKQ